MEKTMKVIYTHTLYRPRSNEVYGNYTSKEAANNAATCALISEGLICKMVEHETPIIQEQTPYIPLAW